MTRNEFGEIIKEHQVNDKEISANLCLTVLAEHFLGEDWYSIYMDNISVNIDIVESILMKTQKYTRIKRIKRFLSGLKKKLIDIADIIFRLDI